MLPWPCAAHRPPIALPWLCAAALPLLVPQVDAPVSRNNHEDDYLPLTFAGGGFGGGVGALPDALEPPITLDNYSLLKESLVCLSCRRDGEERREKREDRERECACVWCCHTLSNVCVFCG